MLLSLRLGNVYEDDDDSDDYHVLEETVMSCHHCNKHLDEDFFT